MAISVAVLLIPTARVKADSYDDQIAALRAQAAVQQQNAAQLHAAANDYRGKVAELNNRIAGLRSEITATQLKSKKTQNDIDKAKADMADQKAILAEGMRSMYLESGTTPLEMLASSQNLSDFFNRQAYLDRIKDKVISSTDKISEIKINLEKEQKQLQTLLANKEAQQQQVASEQAEVQRLEAIASQSAAAADQSVRDKNSEISKLKAEQAAVLAAKYIGSGLMAGGTCGGGYPARWCNAAQDSLVDNWGMYNRECVSYTAFKVAASGRFMPYWGGRGNAKEWPGNARAAGIPMDFGTNAKPGDVAIDMDGYYGHAMYVEAVSGGKVYVSQYNYGNNGEYSTMTIPAGGLYFIHFQ
ncbi:CHAP domain-containing protein [bacterium]|nr:MAG: CHAP domain-containing protein [bacterium]